jgi:mRNA interferase ChpB
MAAAARLPDRGQIWSVNLSPTVGREQQGERPVLVVTRAGTNASGLVLICPISQGANQARYAGFAVSLMGTGTQTQGVVMCNQPRTVDLLGRGARLLEAVPLYVVDDVLDRVAALLE